MVYVVICASRPRLTRWVYQRFDDGGLELKRTNKDRFALRYHDDEIPIRRFDFVIGRTAECDLALPGGLVSRQHARIRLEGEALVVEDLASRNGVYVNHKRIERPTSIAHGDVIGIGLESLELVDQQLLQRPEHLSTLPPPCPPSDAAVDEVTVAASLDVLTNREKEVLELIALGHTQKEMAEKLAISVKTVEAHRARIVEKLHCRTRAELVSYAINAGLLRTR